MVRTTRCFLSPGTNLLLVFFFAFHCTTITVYAYEQEAALVTDTEESMLLTRLAMTIVS